MAIIQFTTGEMRGSIGGITYSAGHYGSVAKTKGKTPTFSTNQALRQKARFTELAQMWSSLLSDSDRLAWNNASANFPHTNSLGQTIYVTGFNLFQEFNGNILLIDEPIILLPPAPTVVTPPTAIIASANSTTPSLFRELTPHPVAGTASYVLFVTQPFRVGISNANNKLKFAGHTLTGGGSILNVSIYYSDVFGALISGSKIYGRCFAISKSTGITSGSCVNTIVINDWQQYAQQHSIITGTIAVGDIVTGFLSGNQIEVETIITSTIFIGKNKTGIFTLNEPFTAAPSGATGLLNRKIYQLTLSDIIDRFQISIPLGLFGTITESPSGNTGSICFSNGSNSIQVTTTTSFTVGNTITQATTGATATILTATQL